MPGRSRFPSARRVLSWFVPGLGIKRWMLMILAGITLLALGLGMLLLDLYRTNTTDPLVLNILSYASLRFLPRLVRVLIFGGLGVGLVTYGIWGLNRALLRPFMRPGDMVLDQLRDFRRRIFRRCIDSMLSSCYSIWHDSIMSYFAKSRKCRARGTAQFNGGIDK